MKQLALLFFLLLKFLQGHGSHVLDSVLGKLHQAVPQIHGAKAWRRLEPLNLVNECIAMPSGH